MMFARQFAIALIVAAVCSTAPAQERGLQVPVKVARIGLLGYGIDRSFIEAFRQGMRQLGHVEGSDYIIEDRGSEASTGALPGRASDLVRLNVDVILTYGTPSVRAAQQATSTIPIVMNIGPDPVQLGIIKSFAHPGGNVTGVAGLGVELWAKRLQLLQQTVPNLTGVVFLSNPSNPGNVVAASEFGKVAEAAAVKVRFVSATNTNDLERAFAEIQDLSSQALVVAWDSFLQLHARAIGDFAVSKRLPTVASVREYVKDGILISYGTKETEQWRRAAWYVDRILEGTKPTDLPVEQPTVFELVINGKTAKAIGLKIPSELLLIADKVIE